ncbi:MAG: type IIL restriction-modification enzyme MmeI [bacterium]
MPFGLATIIETGGTITFAHRSIKWLGAATVEVDLVTIRRGLSNDSCTLDGEAVEFISSRLDNGPEVQPQSLQQNKDKSFRGQSIGGKFMVEPEIAEQLMLKNPQNRDCLLPFLNGEDLNNHPSQLPSRCIICFFNWPIERAQKYPDLFHIIEKNVRPQRIQSNSKQDRDKWWLHARPGIDMKKAIASLKHVLVRSRVSEFHMLVFVPTSYVFGDALVVFAFDDNYHFSLLQSNIHEAWVWRHASSLESRNRYTPTDCFDTFPFPQNPSSEARQRADQVGGEYHECRRQIMLARQIGMTATYNLFHNPACADPDIARLRELHTEMDRAILARYGWDDLAPAHNFYQNERKQIRFTVSPLARREILGRLLDLNLKLA